MAYLQLPVAFRSLSRLSSALSAKASALRSFLLNLFFCIALQILSLLPLRLKSAVLHSFFLVYFSLPFSIDNIDLGCRFVCLFDLQYSVFKVRLVQQFALLSGD